ncbi:MAG: BlaI/MecI/CopY family transcriptional regulator [Bacteroidales bacterium]|jgi:predicted transcriptional regulator|nr:BlaI/MecI/CopY family transcriptional regulator [Bacteroidales bacterium]
MNKTPTSRPTEAEMEILQVLWERGPSTVREVNEKLNRHRRVGYTTTLKLLQIMTEKGLTKRDQEQRTHIYAPLVERNETRAKLLDRFVNTAFGGSAMSLVMQALGNHNASEEELAQIRILLSEMESRNNDTNI